MKLERKAEKIGLKSSLVRGLLVLECFEHYNHGHTLSELVKKLGIPKSSLHRVLKIFSKMRYLRYEEFSKRYHLGVRVLSLGFAVLESLELREIARPYMEKLSRECHKTINLAVLDEDEMVYVERVKVEGVRSYNISIGHRLSPWRTAIGKAVLAYLEPEVVAEMMKKAKDRGLFKGDKKQYLKVLTEARNNGFAEDNQEFLRGIIAIAVPVFSSKGVVGAINLVSEPEDTPIEELRKVYAPQLINMGTQLSEALGYKIMKDR
jgi:IclR family transcriptional regulator, pca regulon regulatory protein